MIQSKRDLVVQNMNGYWTVLLKVFVAIFPIFLFVSVSWGTWVTSETYQNKYLRESGYYITNEVADAAHDSLKDSFEKKYEVLDARQRLILEQQIRILTILENEYGS